MIYRVLTDLVVVIHFLFICFVIGGGLLVLRWRNILWIHIPAVVWGAFIEFSGWICPLTPLENEWRIKGGGLEYSGGFIEHYLIPIIYPAGLTHSIQIILGLFVALLNIIIYWIVWKTWTR